LITAETTRAGAAEVANANAITAEAVTARAAEAKANTALAAILTDYGTTNTVSNAGIADSSVSLNTMARTEAKVDALASFTLANGDSISADGTGSDIAVTVLNAINATAAKANDVALGDVETRVNVVEENGSNAILAFMKRLFGGS
jgi:hypothetical protein